VSSSPVSVQSSFPSSAPSFCVPEVLVAEEDFDNDDGSWGENMRVSEFGTLGSFLGPYGQNTDSPSKTFDIPKDSDYVVVEFLFYEIDLWEEEDQAFVLVGDTIVDLGPFSSYEKSQNNEYSGEVNGIEFEREKQEDAEHIGFSEVHKDQVHNVTLTIPSSIYNDSGSLTIGFDFNMTRDLTEQSAGIDNFEIIAHQSCAPSGIVPTKSPLNLELIHQIHHLHLQQ
jgi:hypothetical protein